MNIADFLNAHYRHLSDADLLFRSKPSRLANADHLYGMAAECGLKRLMCAFGMTIRESDGAPVKKEDRVHIDKVWMRYATYCSGTNGQIYGLSNSDPFTDWKIEQRYEQEENFDFARVEPHKKAAHEISKIVKRATIEMGW